VRTAIQTLSNCGFLTIKSTSKFSIITICNYDRYQNSENVSDQQIDQQVTSKRPASDQQVTTSKECKECKNEKKENIIYTFVSQEVTTESTQLTDEDQDQERKLMETHLSENLINLISLWNSKTILQHITHPVSARIQALIQKAYDKTRKALQMKNPSYQEFLMQRIDDYAVVLSQPAEYYFTYSWTLWEFIQRGCVKAFSPESRPFENLRHKKSPGMQAYEKKQEENKQHQAEREQERRVEAAIEAERKRYQLEQEKEAMRIKQYEKIAAKDNQIAALTKNLSQKYDPEPKVMPQKTYIEQLKNQARNPMSVEDRRESLQKLLEKYPDQREAILRLGGQS
jgi:hypothetical protein